MSYISITFVCTYSSSKEPFHSDSCRELRREQVLQNEMNLAFSVYNQFAIQVEQAKIELKKESPIFSTLNPIEIPSSKSEPIVWKIVFKYFSIGIIMCLMIMILGAFKWFLLLSIQNKEITFFRALESYYLGYALNYYLYAFAYTHKKGIIQEYNPMVKIWRESYFRNILS